MVNPVSGRDGAGRAKAATSSIAVDFQSLLSVANRRQFLQGSTRAVLPAGTIALQPGGPSLAYFIEAGLARAFWSLPDGRQTTVAIIRPMQLVTESTLTILDLENVRAMAATELEVATAIALQQGVRVRDAYRLIAVRSLGNIRERVAYDLLDRAAQS